MRAAITALGVAAAALVPLQATAAADAYLCYRTRAAAGVPRFAGVTADLGDQTGARSVKVKRPVRLCVPADLGAGVADAATHLRGYRARPLRGEPPLQRDFGVTVSSWFGDAAVEQIVDTKPRPRMLLVPAALGDTPPDPDQHAVDHYRCQRAATAPGSAPLPRGSEISVRDAFQDGVLLRVGRPSQLCTPVSAFGAPVDDPAAALLCHRARRARGEPRHDRVSGLSVADAVGAGALDRLTEVELCLSSRAIARCNGFAGLCDRGFEEVSYATTHNAMSNAAEGWLGPNQNFSITSQLEDGIRALMLDTWYFNLQPVLCHGGDVVPCDIAGMKPLADGLAEITDFLDSWPDEVVSIIFESYVTEADTEAAFVASDLLRYVHVQAVGDPWPTLRELLAANTRLVVLTDDGGASLPWHHYVWDHSWETRFSYQTPGDFSCARNRGAAGNDLFILNHFLTNFIGSPALAEQVNYNPLFIDRALQCESESGRLPNFVTVDFYDIGDVFAVVDELNGVGD